jgi:ferredoxin/flavodoxin
MDSVIYYFSATGNSFKVARDLAEKLEKTQLVRITNKSIALARENNFRRVGIVFPVYYYGLPVMVRRFVKGLNIVPETYVYTAATCGGSVGAALKQMKDLVEGKGAKVSAAFTVVMPDNYQVMYSPPSRKKQQRLFAMESIKTDQMAGVISRHETNVWDVKGTLAAGVLGGILYKTFHPEKKDTHFWTDEKCNGCGICAQVCPSENIEMKNERPRWLHRCEHCLGCMHWCPRQALQYKKGTVKRERYHHPDVQVKELIEG